MALLINGITTPGRTFPSLRVGGTVLQCLPYTSPAHAALVRELQAVRKVREAVHHIVHRIGRYAPANAAFAGIPTRTSPLALGRTLRALLDGKDIVICFDPTRSFPRGRELSGASTVAGGATGDRYLTLTALELSGRGRSVEATILHELAHLDGATNDVRVRDAEDVLRRSRMGDQFRPRATG